MEAPERIFYAPFGDMREDMPITEIDIEYIRKDAVMNLLQEELSKALLYSEGATKGIKRVIDKVSKL